MAVRVSSPRPVTLPVSAILRVSLLDLVFCCLGTTRTPYGEELSRMLDYNRSRTRERSGLASLNVARIFWSIACW